MFNPTHGNLEMLLALVKPGITDILKQQLNFWFNNMITLLILLIIGIIVLIILYSIVKTSCGKVPFKSCKTCKSQKNCDQRKHTLPFNKWNGLFQDKGRSPVCHHWLLSNLMVSHHNAVPVSYKPVTWEPGYEEQETKPSKAGQRFPVDRNQASQSSQSSGECNEADHLSGKPEFPSKGSVHLWCFCWLAVTY